VEVLNQKRGSSEGTDRENEEEILLGTIQRFIW
jgi:hypothetical protein